MRIKKMIAPGMALLLGLVLCACSAAPVEKQSFALDTFITVRILSGGDVQDAEAALARVDECEKILSAHRAGSDIDRINNSGGEEVPVDALTERVLRCAMEMHGIVTDGALDITLYEASKLWDYKSTDPRVPTQEEIGTALRSRGMERLTIEEHAVTADGIKLDLGAVAKGAIGDEAVKALRERGVKSALINLGGNIMTLGDKSGGSGWLVGIDDPLSDGQAGTLRFHGSRAVATSSGTQRYFTVDGNDYHHILDPETGRPADSGLASVTVLAPDGLTADALSTAIFVMGEERAREMFAEHGLAEMEISAVLIRRDGTTAVLGNAEFTEN